MHSTSLIHPVHGFEVEPLSDRCHELWQRGEHALLGVSTGNSYFSQERLTALARWGTHFFATVDLLYVDTNIEKTLMDCGIGAHEASRLVKSRLKDMRRKLRRVVENLGSDASRLRVRPLSEFLTEHAYQSVRKRVDDALESDSRFASVCEDMVRRFLSNKDSDGNRTLEGARAGMDYLLAELPFFLDSPSIFDVPSSSNCYHLKFPLVEYLVQHYNGLLPVDRQQGYLVVRPVSEQ